MTPFSSYRMGRQGWLVNLMLILGLVTVAVNTQRPLPPHRRRQLQRPRGGAAAGDLQQQQRQRANYNGYQVSGRTK